MRKRAVVEEEKNPIPNPNTTTVYQLPSSKVPLYVELAGKMLFWAPIAENL